MCNDIIRITQEQGTILLGVWNTLNVKAQKFDISPWVDEFGSDGVLTILHQRQGDELPYEPENVTVKDNVAIWTFDEMDTAIAGEGAAAIVYKRGNDVIARSRPFATYVSPTLGMSGSTVPDPLEAWFNKIMNASDNSQAAAKSALSSASDAAEASKKAVDAQGRAEAAQTGAEAAKNAAVNAQTEAGRAKTEAESARDKADDNRKYAEAFALGTDGGTPVPQFAERNAKFFATQAEAAKTAAENAKTSAEKAATIASTAAADAPVTIVINASGTTISVLDSAERPPKKLRLFGKTTQNGTPSWENPIPLVSPGDSGSVTVSIGEAQTLIAQTPNGLPGIPNVAGGNYKENGRMWLGDVIDFARGKYIKYIERGIVDITSVAKLGNGLPVGVYDAPGKKNVVGSTIISSHAQVTTSAYTPGLVYQNGVNVCFVGDENDTKETLQAKYNGSELLYMLANPIEIDLTAEEMAQYAALLMEFPNSTVTNDAGAWMELQYVADTKTYIDNKFAELSAAVIAAGTN